MQPTDRRIPAGIGPKRRSLLEVALAEYDARVREEPPGSNRGPRVDAYLPSWSKKPGAKGPAWCAFFVGWVSREALGVFLPGGHVGSCHRLMGFARKAGRWADKWASVPAPGDVFIMDTDGDAGLAGHTGYVLRVSEDGATINTVEGNCGNRVQLGIRDVHDPAILGWISTVPSEPSEAFERGVIEAKPVGKAATR